MFKRLINSGNEQGMTLIEIMAVIAVIAILAGFGVPAYSALVGKSKVRRAATDLLQNMRMAKTMAIKENRTYRVNIDLVANTYAIGFDGNSDGQLTTLNFDTFGVCNDSNNDRLPDNTNIDCVKRMSLKDLYGDSIKLLLSTPLPNKQCGQDTGTISQASPMTFTFNADGTAGSPDSVYFENIAGGYIYCVKLAYATGKLDVYMWDKDTSRWEEML
jgi:prepilin-type N-terminal cleavage/methylation domain-containing protein